MRSFRSSQRN